MAEVEYKCTAFYDRADEIGVRWDDPGIGIDWPVKAPLLSPKDAALPSLSEVAPRLAF
jgi:dTDP-4-dehydrorhamnose 3,5-epimerase